MGVELRSSGNPASKCESVERKVSSNQSHRPAPATAQWLWHWRKWAGLASKGRDRGAATSGSACSCHGAPVLFLLYIYEAASQLEHPIYYYLCMQTEALACIRTASILWPTLKWHAFGWTRKQMYYAVYNPNNPVLQLIFLAVPSIQSDPICLYGEDRAPTKKSDRSPIQCRQVRNLGRRHVACHLHVTSARPRLWPYLISPRTRYSSRMCVSPTIQCPSIPESRRHKTRPFKLTHPLFPLGNTTHQSLTSASQQHQVARQGKTKGNRIQAQD